MPRRLALLALCLSLATQPAVASDTTKLQLSPLYLLGSDPAQTLAEHTAMPGDVLLSMDVAYADTAKTAPAKVMILGIPFALSPGVNLRGASLPATDPRFATKIYCTGKLEPGDALRRPPAAAQKGPRFAKKVSICLSDATGAGTFDGAFIDGALWPEESGKAPIEPVAYTAQQFEPIKPGGWRLTYEKGAALQGAVLDVMTDLVDGRTSWSQSRIGADPAHAPQMQGEIGITQPRLPRAIAIGEGQVTVLSLDPTTKAIRYRIDRPVSRSRVQVQVNFLGTYGGTIYTFD